MLFASIAISSLSSSVDAISASDQAAPIAENIELAPHEPIIVDNNREIVTLAASEGWPGNGIPSDPFVIEGYAIDAHGGECGVLISNTTFDVTIRGCSIYNLSTPAIITWDSTSSIGIYLRDARNVLVDGNCIADGLFGLRAEGSEIVVQNNHILNNYFANIYVEGNLIKIINNTCSDTERDLGGHGSITVVSSNDLVIDSNTCYNSSYGIHASSISNCVFSNNICFNNSLSGIQIGPLLFGPSSHDFQVLNNICYNNGRGIFIGEYDSNHYLSSGVSLIGNNCSSNSRDGMYLLFLQRDAQTSNGYGGRIENNTCSNNLEAGINSEWCSNNLMSNNTCTGNGEGIALSYSNNNELLNNTVNLNDIGLSINPYSPSNVIEFNCFMMNWRYGVYSSGQDNVFYMNRFIDNNGASSVFTPGHPQALDDGGNKWNVSGPVHGYGNYWSDWTSPDTDHNGIVDSPYVIPDAGSCLDNYPLTRPMTVVPSEPTEVSSVVIDGVVRLSWSYPKDDGCAEILQYNVYRSTSGPMELIGNASGLSFSDLGVVDGAIYHYIVRAVNIAGEGKASSEAVCTPMSVPSAPQNLTIALDGMTVKLSWQAPEDNGGSTINGYRVYRSADNGSEAYLASSSSTGMTDSNVTNGTTYQYRVTAINSVGEGLTSSRANASLPSSNLNNSGESNETAPGDDNPQQPGNGEPQQPGSTDGQSLPPIALACGVIVVAAIAGLVMLRRRTR